MMSKFRKAFIGSALGILLAAGLTFAAEGPAASGVLLRRYALVVGSNNGGPTRVQLKYAASDARAFAAVLRELGGVRESDIIVLTDPDLGAFQTGMQRVQQIITGSKAADERRELLIYYSGHSDETGLILGNSIYPYETLRKTIEGVPVDVHVAVLDSCASGALTRAKGGVWRPAFLMDTSTDMKGHAFLTSSSAEESAQESDRIGASFFTHYLVSGLRGAADTNGDGLVTLNEAYAYAFQETLASTEKTQYGPQHPAYDISLTGTGDLVLTDLRAASAGLTVSDEVSGRIYIRDARGMLAVELNKQGGQKVDLGLEPGTYGVVLDSADARYRGEIRIAANTRTVLSSSDLKTFSTETTLARGDAGRDEGDAPEPPHVTEDFHFSFIPDIIQGLFSSNSNRNFSINALVGTSANMNGFEVGGLVNIESEDMSGFQAAGLGNLILGEAKGFQSAGIGNIVAGAINGFQAAGLLNFSGRDARYARFAGILNYTGGDFSGFQAAGIGNVTVGTASGVSLAGLFNLSNEPVSGFEAAGIGSLAFGGLRGVQTSGIFNVTVGQSSGAQIAGIFNYSQSLLKGAQISEICNYAGEIAGPQISLINVADTVNGAQIGLINVAGSVKGTQVGLLNFSRQVDGVPIGLFTFEQAGRQELEVWWDGDLTWHAGFKLGSKYTYTLLFGGYVEKSDPMRWSYGAGLGGHLPLGPLGLDFDLSVQSIHEGSTNWYITSPGNMLPQLRFVFGLPLLGMTLNGGASVDIYVPYLSTEPDGSRTKIVRFAPQFIVGIEL
jgi:hypothetical protein